MDEMNIFVYSFLVGLGLIGLIGILMHVGSKGLSRYRDDEYPENERE